MNITIAQHVKVFSHVPGTSCYLPGSGWQVQAFPQRFCFISPEKVEYIVSLALKGPVRDFTLLQDLECHAVLIFGTWQEGFCLWQIGIEDCALYLRLKRAKEEGCCFGIDGKMHHLLRGQTLSIAKTSAVLRSFPNEHLSFGCHKSQEWEAMKQRSDMREILPIWLRLGQSLTCEASHEKGTMRLLRECQDLSLKDKEKLPDALDRLFRAGFRAMFMPSLIDDLHQGILEREESLPDSLSPLSLLTEGAEFIRSLFFREERDGLIFLPALPSPWHCGRFTHLTSSYGDRISFEWSKKLIRRIQLCPSITRQIPIFLPRVIKSFRVRSCLKSRGWRQENGASLSCEAGTLLYLDRFEK